MNFDYYLERNELLTCLLIEDTETFDDLKQWLLKCKPTNQELKELLNEIQISNMIKNKLYESGVTKK
jgi:hypothetical protein